MPPRPPGHDFLDRNAAGRHPFASAFGHLELDLEPGATPPQALPAREPAPREVEPFTLGVRLTGHNGGDTKVSVSGDGVSLEHGASLDGVPCVLEFDSASFVLTAFGRINAGTVRGDAKVADRFTNMFFRI